MKRTMFYLPDTLAALETLGSQIAVARRELGWTSAELADRAGVSAAVIARIEKGAPGTAIGTVFEAALVCGVPLFGAEPSELSQLSSLERARLAVLPARVRKKTVVVNDDF